MSTKRLKCLLIVDVQEGFINEFTRHIPARVERLQEQYEYVFATRFFNDDPSMYRSVMNWERFGRDSSDFPLAFKPKAGTRIIDKPVYTCVSEDFLGTLRKLNVETVDVCGIDTDVCVAKCAADLFENGIRPIVLKDYCASHAGPQIHQMGLAILKRYIGEDQIQ